MMNEAVTKFEAMVFDYGDKDDRAYEEIGRRVAAAARTSDGYITYSDLVNGIEFRLTNVRQGDPYTIDVTDWTMLDRNIIASFLGRLSAESYQRGDFLASAVVVLKETKLPSDGFYNLAREVGLLRTKNPDKAYLYWATEFAKATEWYRQNEW